PEGTFDARPGLKPFRPGAFGAAWRGARPIVPVVVKGARTKLPSGAMLPRPGPLDVRVCRPLASDRFRSAKDLMHATRAAMLEHLGEPDLLRTAAGGDGEHRDEAHEHGHRPATGLPAHT